MEYKLEPIGDSLYIKGRIGWKGLKKSEYLESGEYRIINGKALTSNGIDWNECGFISKERYEESPEIMLETNDIVITKDGTIGKVDIIKSLDKPTTVASGLFVLRNSNPEEFNTMFIYYFLKSPIFKQFIEVRKEGSVIPHLYQKDFVELEIPKFNINNQKLIANILCSIDNKIDNNKQIIKNLEELSQTLFKHWFVDFEFPDEDGEPYKSNGGEMIDSELGKIPKNWEIKSLKDFIEIIDNRGKTPPLDKKSKKYPIIDVKALSGISRIIDYEKCSKFVSEDTYNNWFRNGHPKRGDILLSTVGSIGEIKMFHYDIGTIAQNVVALRSKNPYFTYDLINKIKSLFLTYNIGSVQPSIKITHINKIKVIYPLEKTIESYEEKIKKYIDFIFLKSSENKKLITLRDTILPKLMSGEIEIPDDVEVNTDELSI
ncbi:restriction endonuclease subunit S [Staphylococcus hominis]|uniref:restriction endonuclease subunit S n=1 Tax=Staphylococcus hominis TaxID=1290 RepID=UPI001F55D7D8|nr:restriction endonuclease subunit S [Staphylococcus hominis]MCI2880040.1 restriction endonuclease subunit S [Staphylococcus hominis]